MGFLLFLSFLVSLPFGWAAVIQQKFEGSTTLKMSLGTPAQGPFVFKWNHLFADDDSATLTVGSEFRHRLSTSFEQRYSDSWATYGTDTIQLEGQKLKQELQIFKREVDSSVGMRWGSDYKPTFLYNLLTALGGTNTVVFAITQKTTLNDQHGTIILGNDRPALCNTKWQHYLAHSQEPYQMAIYATDLIIGNLRVEEITPLVFTVTEIAFEWTMYKAAKTALRVKPDRTISCNTTAVITVGTGEEEFHLQPQDYIEDHEWYCLFRIQEAKTFVKLPFAVLRGKCLSYDFDRNRISVGTVY